MDIRYPRLLITYKGIEFVGVGEDLDKVCIVTDDATVASKLSFQPGDGLRYQYEKWVPMTEVERWVQQNAFGIYQGEQVEIGRLGETTCFIDAEWNLPGLEQRDRNLWQGIVPRHLVTDIRVEETEENLWRWRKKKSQT